MSSQPLFTSLKEPSQQWQETIGISPPDRAPTATMFKSLLLVFAVLAVASAQYIASPYSTYSAGAYPAYSGVSAYSAYPAYSGVSTYGAYPYAYSGLGYGSSYLYR
ncbi:hypothetical protein FOCC_FOCC002123 [Frankliniella occidentalis]|nr:hypothetical protein FOCC_FOCC002123 [Frankliniella occidentalis]